MVNSRCSMVERHVTLPLCPAAYGIVVIVSTGVLYFAYYILKMWEHNISPTGTW